MILRNVNDIIAVSKFLFRFFKTHDWLWILNRLPDGIPSEQLDFYIKKYGLFWWWCDLTLKFLFLFVLLFLMVGAVFIAMIPLLWIATFGLLVAGAISDDSLENERKKNNP